MEDRGGRLRVCFCARTINIAPRAPSSSPDNQVVGIVGDSRLAAVAVRKLEDMNETAKARGIPRVMEFTSVKDDESGLELCGITWQEGGTGDVYLSAAILFGVGCGKQGTGAGAMTDNAGFKLLSI